MPSPGYELSKLIAERIARLPEDAQRLIALGCLQRCYPIYDRSVEEFPHRDAYRPAIDAGLALAWARAEGLPVDESDRQAVAAKLRSFDPDDPEAPELEGDGSWVVLTYGGLAYELELTYFPTWAAYTKATRTTASNLVYTIYGQIEKRAGRAVNLTDKGSTSAFLLEMATQARHEEWLRYRGVDVEIVRRIRADSERVGRELLATVDDWRVGQVGLL
jgi:hypothetical protein